MVVVISCQGNGDVLTLTTSVLKDVQMRHAMLMTSVVVVTSGGGVTSTAEATIATAQDVDERASE